MWQELEVGELLHGQVLKFRSWAPTTALRAMSLVIKCHKRRLPWLEMLLERSISIDFRLSTAPSGLREPLRGVADTAAASPDEQPSGVGDRSLERTL